VTVPVPSRSLTPPSNTRAGALLAFPTRTVHPADDERALVAQHFESVDDYISSFPADVQGVLQAVRDTIHATAPGAQESISYQIPTFSIGARPVVYLAGWKKHISLYIPELDETLESQVAPYLSGQGTAKFPLAKPIPHR
jgi:uncharacterized protein YdhG (YjbR/CyaY superfamily)